MKEKIIEPKGGKPSWSITDEGILYKNTIYKFDTINNINTNTFFNPGSFGEIELETDRIPKKLLLYTPINNKELYKEITDIIRSKIGYVSEEDKKKEEENKKRELEILKKEAKTIIDVEVDKKTKWKLTNVGVIHEDKLYKFSNINNITPISTSSTTSTGNIKLEFTDSNKAVFLTTPGNNKELYNKIFNYIASNYGNEKIRKENEKLLKLKIKHIKNAIYEIEGNSGGRFMRVFEDHVNIITNPTLVSVLGGNATDGEKTIYYKDCIGLQFKNTGLVTGYLQIETASSLMNRSDSNLFNENTFTFDKQTNEKVIEIYYYIMDRVAKYKKLDGNITSSAEEIKKYKELLDMEAITQEEYDLKKKQLLAL